MMIEFYDEYGDDHWSVEYEITADRDLCINLDHKCGWNVSFDTIENLNVLMAAANEHIC